MQKFIDQPDKLYGREKHLNQFRSAFTNTTKGSGGIILVPGHSGTGKTSLVMKMKEEVESQNGWFVSGKFEQYQQNIPYSAIKQALSQLWEEMEKLEKIGVKNFSNILRNDIGTLGPLIVELVPDLINIFDEQSDIEQIGFNEARHRFTTVIRNFLTIASQPEHPVVLFLDDWQWADSASLTLLKDLGVGSQIKYLLLPAAYRDDEINNLHPFAIVMDDLSKIHPAPETIQVNNLSSFDIKIFLDDTMTEGIVDKDNFTDLIIKHTNGNPFFVKTFLNYFQNENKIKYDPQEKKWIWNIESIDLPHKIVDLFLRGIQKLNSESKELIFLASLLGNRFELKNLVIISNRSIDYCKEFLAPLIKMNFLVSDSSIEDIQESSILMFTHDKIQQACYLLDDENKKIELHLEIGRLLLSTSEKEEQDKYLYEILDHINYSQSLVNNSNEIIKFAKLNIIAARKARSQTAYSAMLNFYKMASEFVKKTKSVEERFWTDHYKLAIELYRGLGESEFIEGTIENAEIAIQICLNNCNSNIEKAETLNIKILHYTLHARYEEAIETGRLALSKLNIELPQDNYEEFRNKEIDLVYKNLNNRSIESLIDSPKMEKKEIVTATKILITMGPPCYRTHQKLWSVIVPKVVNFTLLYGLSPLIGYSHTAFGGLIGWVSYDYERAKAFTNLSEKVMDTKFINPSEQSVFYLMIGSSSRHWFKHLKFSSQDYQKAYNIGLQSGNLQYTAYAFGHNMYCRFFQGTSLNDLIPECEQSLIFSKSRHNQWAIDLLMGGIGIFKELFGSNSELTFNEKSYLSQVDKHKNIQVKCIYKVLKANQLFIIGEYEKALELSNEAGAIIYTVGTQGLLPWPEHKFLRFMILSSLYKDSTTELQNKWLPEMEKIFQQLKIWNKYSPENYQFKVNLAEAELARIKERFVEAINNYKSALDQAQKFKFSQWVAIINERLSNICKTLNSPGLSQIYWQQAYKAFENWGASQKTQLMEMEFKHSVFNWMSELNKSQKITKPAQFNFTDLPLTEDLVQIIKKQTSDSKEAFQKIKIIETVSKLETAAKNLRYEVSERKRVEKELIESEQRYKILQNASFGGLAIHDNGKILECNQALCNLTGYYYNEIIGMNISSLISDDSVNIVKDKIKSEYQLPYEVTGLKKNRFQYPLLLEGKTFPYKGKLVRVTEFRDITENKKSEIELQESKGQLRQINTQLQISIDNMPNAYILWDLNLKVVEWNNAAEKIFGFKKEEVLGENPIKLIVSDQSQNTLNQILENLKAGDISEFFEKNNNIRKDGKIISCRWTNTAMVDNNNKIKGIITLAQDITDQIKAQEIMIERQRLSAIGEMSSGIAHDFNNTLQSILGNVELLLLDTDISQKQKKRLETINIATQDAASRVEQLQRFSGVAQKTKNYSSIDIFKLINEVKIQSRPLWKDNSEKNGIFIDFQISGNVDKKIKGNAAELRSVFYNLIKNSIEAMPKGGVIKIELCIENNQLIILFSDSGVGMDEETKKRIFQPFFTTKGYELGRGLGLSSVFSTINEHGGSIIVLKSKLGTGTTIEIKLPYSDFEDVEQDQLILTGSKSIKKAKILYVDDDKLIRETTKQMFKFIGHNIDLASNGYQALELVEKKNYDLIITDLGMPEMNGWELSQRLHNKLSGNIKIAIASGWGIQIDSELIKKNNVDFIISKPYKISEINDLILKAINE